MNVAGVIMIVIAVWLVIAIAVGVAIGQVVRRANEDARLYGSFFAPSAEEQQRRSAAGTDESGGN